MQTVLTSCCLCVTKLYHQKFTPENLFRNKLKTELSEELKSTGFHTVACNIKNNVINENDATGNVISGPGFRRTRKQIPEIPLP